jgi:hypothetical protein
MTERLVAAIDLFEKCRRRDRDEVLEGGHHPMQKWCALE